MGKGDIRTARGKIYRGTFGKRRPRKAKGEPGPAQTSPINRPAQHRIADRSAASSSESEAPPTVAADEPSSEQPDNP